MFSFGAKKANPSRPKTKQQSNFLDSLNFGDFAAGIDNQNDVVSDDDADLEAELAALTGGTNVKAVQRGRKPPKQKPKQAVNAGHDFSEEFNSDSECSSIDDAEVEGELLELCKGDDEDVPSTDNLPAPEASQGNLADTSASSSVLEDRFKMYCDAKVIAQQKGDTAKMRRFDRAIKTIKDLMKQAREGKEILAEDIPPALPSSFLTLDEGLANQSENRSSLVLPLAVNQQNVSNAEPAVKGPPPIPPRSDKVPAVLPSLIQAQTIEPARDPELEKVIHLRAEYKNKALSLKQEGNRSAALQCVILVKVCDQLIKDAQEGKPIDWSQLNMESNKQPSTAETHLVASAQPLPEEPIKQQPDMPAPSANVVENNASVSTSNDTTEEIPLPKTTLEALEQRLAKYQSVQQESADNPSKYRRIGRIVKQYQDAIRLCKAGKPVPFDELPDPPGFPPIPGALKAESAEADQPTPKEAAPAEPDNKPVPAAAVSLPTQVKSPVAAPPTGAKPKTALQTQQEKQLALLLERQALFKQAALEAKKSGDITQAKEYLRLAKGFDPLIEANQSGIRVDMQTIPVPPQLMRDPSTASDDKLTEEGFVELALEPSAATLRDEGAATVTQLELLLEEQKKKCILFRNHHKEIGEVANANRFDQMLLATLNDIQKVRKLAMSGITPTWTYEMKSFAILKCCSDLKEDELEVKVIRGVAYNVPNPKTVDTYVKFEVPLPNTENPTKHKTNLIRDTNSPEYNEKFLINFARQSRTAQRIFKSKAIKFEVYSKGGFLRSDVLLGTVALKLADLLNHCEVRAALDLMDGRKTVGGKLEVSARLREPLAAKETERFQEKWVVLN